MKLLAKTIYGSHLYGTSGPDSDRDFKAVYLPDLRDCLLSRVKPVYQENTKQGEGRNTAEDVDVETFSLQNFLQLASQGQTIALDMLHAPDSALLASSPTWEHLRANRSRFYTKHMDSFVGYARTMANKYSIKMSRVTEGERVLKHLTDTPNPGSTRMGEIWESLPKGEFAVKGEDPTNRQDDKRYYEVCGRRMQPTITVTYAIGIIQNVCNEYGARVRRLMSGEAIEFKSLSHAFRAGFQLREIYKKGDLTFPLAEAEFLKKVKYGTYHYYNDHLGDKLDALMAELEALSAASPYPEYMDTTWLDGIVLEAYGVQPLAPQPRAAGAIDF